MSNTSTTISRRRALLCGVSAALLPYAPPAFAAAPMLGLSRPTHLRYKLGSFEVTVFNDGAITIPRVHPVFGGNASAEEVAALAAENFLPADKMEISFAPIMVNTGKELILFDTGNGAGRRPNAGHTLSHLEAAGYSADQVDTVVLTHMHPDHIGGLMENGAPAYPNARYVTGQVDYDFWSTEDKLSGRTERIAKVVQANMVPLADKTTFLSPDRDVVTGVTAVDAFGHTPGHMAYHIESDGRRLLIWADSANHPVFALQRPDWFMGFDVDKEKAVAARKRLFGMAAADRIPATGYHMPFPAVGFVEEHGPGFRFLPASYQLNL